MVSDSLCAAAAKQQTQPQSGKAGASFITNLASKESHCIIVLVNKELIMTET